MEIDLERYRKKATSTNANVRWPIIVLSLLASVFGIAVLFFQFLVPFRDAIGGGFFTLGITFAAEEIVSAQGSREHAKEMWKEEERARTLEKLLKENSLKLEEIKSNMNQFGDSLDSKIAVIDAKLNSVESTQSFDDYRESSNWSSSKDSDRRIEYVLSPKKRTGALLLFRSIIFYSFIAILGTTLFFIPVFSPYVIAVEAGLFGLGLATACGTNKL